jgi:hypothetical protein
MHSFSRASASDTFRTAADDSGGRDGGDAAGGGAAGGGAVISIEFASSLSPSLSQLGYKSNAHAALSSLPSPSSLMSSSSSPSARTAFPLLASDLSRSPAPSSLHSVTAAAHVRGGGAITFVSDRSPSSLQQPQLMSHQTITDVDAMFKAPTTRSPSSLSSSSPKSSRGFNSNAPASDANQSRSPASPHALTMSPNHASLHPLSRSLPIMFETHMFTYFDTPTPNFDQFLSH